MPCFIARYRGKGQNPAADVERLTRLEGVRVLDESPRMLLLEGPEHTLRSAVESMPDWVVAHERNYTVPRPSPILDQTKELKPPE